MGDSGSGIQSRGSAIRSRLAVGAPGREQGAGDLEIRDPRIDGYSGSSSGRGLHTPQVIAPTHHDAVPSAARDLLYASLSGR